MLYMTSSVFTCSSIMMIMLMAVAVKVIMMKILMKMLYLITSVLS